MDTAAPKTGGLATFAAAITGSSVKERFRTPSCDAVPITRTLSPTICQAVAPALIEPFVTVKTKGAAAVCTVLATVISSPIDHVTAKLTM